MKNFLRMSFLSFLGLAAAEEIKMGDQAPAVVVRDQDGKEVKFADVYAQGLTLVYFYPKADTPGCTAQGCSLRDHYAQLTEKGVHVIGVSHDQPEEQQAFREKYKLPFTLIPDTDSTVIKAFGVSTIPMVGMAKRQAYLIKNGKVVWRDLSASTAKQAEDVLKVVETLQ